MLPDQKKQYPWFLAPFMVLWNMLAFILNLTGRMIGAIIGMVMMIAGLILTVTLIAAPIGIPFLILGFLLMLRSIF